MQLFNSIVSLLALSTSVSAAVILPTNRDWVKGTAMFNNPDKDFDFTALKCARTSKDYVYRMGVSSTYRYPTGNVLNQVKLYCITPGAKPFLYTMTKGDWKTNGNSQSEILLNSFPAQGYTYMTVKHGEVIDGINVGIGTPGLPGDGGDKNLSTNDGKIYGVQWAKKKNDSYGSVLRIRFYTR